MSSSSPPYTNPSAEHDAGADDVTGYMESLSLNETGKQQQGEEATGEGYGQVTFRALITSKEAGIIIGKAGAVMAEMREKTGVKAGVSKNTVGVNDRVLTMTGEIDGVARFLSMCADRIDAEGFHAEAGAAVAKSAEIRLLCPTSLVGYVIGRAGARIKEIRETSGVDIHVESNELPGSSERIVEVRGSGEGVRTAVSKIGAILAENWERGMGTVLYNPLGHEQNVQKRNVGNYLWSRGGERSTRGPSDRRSQQPRESAASLTTSTNDAEEPSSTTTGDEIVQNISIPGDMVGCIIGRGGSKITEIRRLSGANINIAKLPHEGGERMFTLRGSAEQNEKALFLLYQQLEGEKERRTEEAAAQAAQAEQE